MTYITHIIFVRQCPDTCFDVLHIVNETIQANFRIHILNINNPIEAQNAITRASNNKRYNRYKWIYIIR